MTEITKIPNSLEEYWMPFTANRDFKANPRLITGAKGMYYTTHRGDKVLDASAGLFCVAAGHGRKEIAEAVHKALTELDYCPPFQYAHPMSFELSRRLAALTPGDLNHIFYGNSGSEAVDSALKIALAYHRAKGEGQRTRLVGRELAYHGVNFGGLTVAGLVNNKRVFGPGLPGALHLRHTRLPEHKFVQGQPETGAELADDLQRMVDLHGADTIAACIVEPIAGSVGSLVPPKGYLQRLREICTQHDIVLIFDEVICGFGRTGKQFAADSFGVVPDMITMAKALTNGVVPMGAVACSDSIHETITGAAPEQAIELFHGYTYSAHPLACAAALAALDVYAEDDLFARAAALAPSWQDAIHSLKGRANVIDIRDIGLMGAVELEPRDGAPGARGFDVYMKCFETGLLVRQTGDTIAMSPPLIISEAQIGELFDILGAAITATD